MIMEKDDQLPEGYGIGTEHVVVIAHELKDMIDELLEKTRAHSHWQERALASRIEEAKAIKDLAGALLSLVKAR